MGEYIELIIASIPGIVALITLIVKLIEYVKKAVREKNWGKLLDLIITYMAAAEEKFTTGAERKEWVLAMIEASKNGINYNVDMNEVSVLIDNLCAMTKKVNPPMDDETGKSEGVIEQVVGE